jgi:hypothetical protein
MTHYIQRIAKNATPLATKKYDMLCGMKPRAAADLELADPAPTDDVDALALEVTAGVTTVVEVLKGVITLEENVADGGVAADDGEEDAGEVVILDPEVWQRGLPLLSLEQVSPVASNTQQ